jgi:hypothetical protein
VSSQTVLSLVGLALAAGVVLATYTLAELYRAADE